MNKILSRNDLRERVAQLKGEGKRIVFTNGCFDILHIGHVRYLEEAKGLGDILVLALNSDASVRSIKGPLRPVVPQDERAYIMASLEVVDYVTIFDEETPLTLIEEIAPDILVKGGDWPLEAIVGRDIVTALGGDVLSIPMLPGYSTTGIIERICKRYAS